MKVNMGNADRILRVLIAGVIIVYLATADTISSDSPWFWVLGALAVVFLGTSMIRFCPLYLPFGLSTAKKSES